MMLESDTFHVPCHPLYCIPRDVCNVKIWMCHDCFVVGAVLCCNARLMMNTT